MNKYRVIIYCKDKLYNYSITDVCIADNVFLARDIIINKYKAYHNIVKHKTLIYDELTRDKLYQASYTLLKDNTRDILQAIKKQDNITIKDIQYNVTNDLLTGLKLANI